MPHTTLIMPVYNAEKTVERAVLSVDRCLAYSADISLIAMDDCSSDSTFSILNELSSSRPYLSLHRSTANVGPGELRNRAIEIANSVFVGFLDADDEINSKAYVDMLRIHNATQSDVITFNAIVKNGSDEKFRYDFDRLVKDRDELVSLCSRGELDGSVLFSLYSKQFINAHNIRFENWYFEDIPFAYKAMMLANQLTIYSEVCYVKHDTDGSILNSISDKHILGLIHSCFEIYDFTCKLPKVDPEIARSDHEYCLAGHISTILEGIAKHGSSKEQHMLLELLGETLKKYNVDAYQDFLPTPKGNIANRYLNKLRQQASFQISELFDQEKHQSIN